ncbi:TetR/AcrR family transcriptional regulator [Dietzia sp. ANT_WB102]|uniref:TetR/AcrR family transcriptional regulator n=1 Tax=Dietzia sp. ANT_WB102 TaxID=2597345 RepID=UPI0011EE6D07|nr:TetR/AcrR family transcriptional regulator [Dietzia sp. ANT_WB102]KAA0918497.1 TetR family transcriptional regulator [Dietzia sp. ANT_WB102]
MASLRERKKADTRTRLSVAAVELLVAEGAEGATVAAIAGRAGVSTRTFHNYFAHREDAFVHFLQGQVADWVRQMEQAPADLNPIAALHRIIRELYRRSADDIDAAENLLVAGEQIGLMLSAEARTCVAEELLEPLYEAIGRRSPQLSGVRVRVLVDLSLAAGASVVRHHPRVAGGDAAGQGDPEQGVEEQGVAESYLDEAFGLLEYGAGRLR